MPLLHTFRRTSLELIQMLGTHLSIDEMMIRFSGRSGQTHRMKNKPVKEGYKWMVLTDSVTSFIVNFTPDGRTAGVQGRGIDEVEHGSDGKIFSLIHYLVIPVIESVRETKRKYVIAMDNYFTLPKVMHMLRSYGIGCVGTARFRPGWPGQNIKEIDEKQLDFNELHWSVDALGTLLIRWMDNGLVFLVSTVHKVSQIVKRGRKRPRASVRNKSHVSRVWGNKGMQFVFILFVHLVHCY